ncbi:MAG: alpha-hydroxy-acid oxidizing protein [Burkholderiaceae bacterium]|nr:alpha-hydroxy-acid oxidizing protein [Burkholderiaceae bacterium]
MPRTLDRLFNLDDVARAARRLLPRPVADFYAGAAEDERTLAYNRQAFDALRLRPRMLTGVTAPSLEARILGRPSALPIVVAPMGAVGFGRRGGDLELARAAAEAGIVSVLSAVATASIESVAAAAGAHGRRWFQVYPLRERALMDGLLERAAQAGCEALVLTVDVPEGGKRERDLRNDFTMPFRFTPRNVAAFAARPAWALDMLRRGVPQLENLAPASEAATVRRSGAASVGAGFDAAFDWTALDALRRRWRGPLLVKGILRADDAQRAQQAGVDGLVVSNHGGRQLDGALPPLHALAGIRAAVGPSMDLLLDGGVRRGTDIAKAIALGATAVMVGRPLLAGVCVGGAAGAAHVLSLLADELRRTLVLCGAADLSQVTGDLVTHAHA